MRNEDNITNQPIHLLQLPKDLLDIIVSYVPSEELPLISLTCRFIHELSLPIIWSKLNRSFKHNSNYSTILRKYGQYIKIILPNSLNGMSQLSVDELAEWCPNIQVFNINSFDMKALLSYSKIFTYWPNLQSITIFEGYEWDLLNNPLVSQLNNLKSVELMHFTDESLFIRQLAQLHPIKQLICDYHWLYSGPSIVFQFDNFQYLESLQLDFPFFGTVSASLLNDIFLKVDHLNQLNDFKISCYSDDDPTNAGFLFEKLEYGFSRLRSLELDLQWISPLNRNLVPLTISRYPPGMLNSRHLTHLFPNVCYQLTRLFTPDIDSSMLIIIVNQCPNLIELGMTSPLPVLNSPISNSLLRLKKLSISTILERSNNDGNYLANIFPNVTHLYMNESEKLRDNLTHWHLIPQLFPKLTHFQFIKNCVTASFNELLTQTNDLRLEEIIVSDRCQLNLENLSRLSKIFPNVIVTFGIDGKEVPQFYKEMIQRFKLSNPEKLFYIGFGFKQFEYGLKKRVIFNIE